jgi:heme A synthase
MIARPAREQVDWRHQVGIKLTSGEADPDHSESPTSSSAPPRDPTRLRIELALAAVLAALLGLGGGGLVLEAAKKGTAGASRSGHVIGGLVLVAAMLVGGRWASRNEQRLRARDPVAIDFERRQQASAPTVAPSRFRRAWRRGYGPRSTGAMMVLLVVFAIGSAIGAVVSHSDASRSAYTQAHGIRATATVIAVGEKKKCGNERCHYTSEILARLTPPVRGTQGTFIHYPAYSSLNAGEQVKVLLDPKQLTYAEIPGHRFTSGSTWLALAGLAVLFAILAFYEVRAFRRLGAFRREHPTGAGADADADADADAEAIS